MGRLSIRLQRFVRVVAAFAAFLFTATVFAPRSMALNVLDRLNQPDEEERVHGGREDVAHRSAIRAGSATHASGCGAQQHARERGKRVSVYPVLLRPAHDTRPALVRLLC